MEDKGGIALVLLYTGPDTGSVRFLQAGRCSSSSGGASTMGKPCKRCRGGWRLDVGKPPLVRSPGQRKEAATATAPATLQAPSPAPAPRGNTQQVYLCVMCVRARVSRPGTQEWQGTASQEHVQGHTRAVALHRWPPSKSQSESQGFHLKNGCRCSENFF
jgi:hypothetical protein